MEFSIVYASQMVGRCPAHWPELGCVSSLGIPIGHWLGIVDSVIFHGVGLWRRVQTHRALSEVSSPSLPRGPLTVRR